MRQGESSCFLIGQRVPPDLAKAWIRAISRIDDTSTPPFAYPHRRRRASAASLERWPLRPSDEPGSRHQVVPSAARICDPV